MFSNLKMSTKILGAITLILSITSGASFWIMHSRINRQAEDAFRDKLHQITGMASATRTWFAGNIEVMVPSRDFKHLEQVPVVVAMRTAEQYASKQGMTFRTPPCILVTRRTRQANSNAAPSKLSKKIPLCHPSPNAPSPRITRSCAMQNLCVSMQVVSSVTVTRQVQRTRSVMPRKV